MLHTALYNYITSNGALSDSVTDATGKPLGPVIDPEGGGGWGRDQRETMPYSCTSRLKSRTQSTTSMHKEMSEKRM